MRGQMGLMEYIVLTFFIFIVIIVLIFFLMGWQITQVGIEKQEGLSGRALGLTKQISASPLFVKEDGVFDDGKLTSLTTVADVCSKLETVLGKEWFFEVTVLDGTDVLIPCNQGNYLQCNYWSFCKQDKNMIAYDLPVNVYRNIGTIVPIGVIPKTDLALLTVGIYVQ